MNELKKLTDALDYLCQGADLLATERGLYKRDDEDMTRFDAAVTARLLTHGCAEIDADILYDDYGPDDGFKSYRRLRVCRRSDLIDSDDMDSFEFSKTLRGLYRNLFLDLIGQILDGKLTEAEEDDDRDDARTYGGNRPARLPLHLVRNHWLGTTDIVDDDSAVIASFTQDEIVDIGDVQMTAEHTADTSQKEEPAEAKAEAAEPKPARASRPRAADREGRP